jgi:hypothetical protein
MPYYPRRAAATIGPLAEFRRPPRGEHGQQPAPASPGRQRQRLGLERLDLRSYEPDIRSVIRVMFGKEPVIHEHTGQLVLSPASAAAATAVRP